MKKIVIVLVLVLTYSILLAQNSKPIVVKPSQNSDLVALQKTNAILKMTLNELKVIVAMQNTKIDSLVLVLNTSVIELKKSADNQAKLNESIVALKTQTSNISDAFIMRKNIAMIGFLGFVFFMILLWLFISRKFKFVNKRIFENNEKINLKVETENEMLKIEISEFKVATDRQSKDLNQNMIRENIATKEAFKIQHEENNKKLDDLSSFVETSIVAINDHVSKNEGSVNEKFTHFESFIEKKMDLLNDQIKGLKTKKAN